MTDKQQRFCEEYVVDWNATQAAIRAGYSEKTAYSIGQENLRKPEIRSYVEEVKNRLEELAGISKLKVLLEHKKIAFSSASMFRDDWMTLKEFEELPDDAKVCIQEIQTTTTVIDKVETTKVRIKTFDKLKALEAIAKLMGYNASTKIESTTEVNHTFNTTSLTDEEIEMGLALGKKLYGGVSEEA